MTAINIVITDREVHVATDTAYLTARGRLAFTAPKAKAIPGKRLVLAVRGLGSHLPALARIMGRFDDVDAARAGLAKVLRARRWRWPLAAPYELFVAGIGAAGPCAFAVTNNRAASLDRFIVHTIPHACVAPEAYVDNAEARLAADPLEFLRAIFAEQRKLKASTVFCPAGRVIVGGAAEVMTIDANGVRKTRLGGWSDRIGEKLDPAAPLLPGGEKATGVAGWRAVPYWLRTPRRKLAALLLALALPAAGRLALATPGILHVAAYRSVPEQAVGAIRLWERPDRRTLLTEGPEAYRAASMEDQRAAAEAWAAARGCTIVASATIAPGAVEHRYTCG